MISSRSSQSRRSSTIRQAIAEVLETRQLLAAGGGWSAAGLVGEYFANNSFSGSPSFTRRDVRINFDWGTLRKPGGSLAGNYAALETDNYSIRWTGQLIPKYTQTYTFKALADDSFKFQMKASGTTTWTTIVDQASASATETIASVGLNANQVYDVRIEYKELTGNAVARLRWSSPSTPEESIDPVTELGFNVSGSWGQAFADIIKNSRNRWEEMYGQSFPGMDANGWPTGNGRYVWQESLIVISDLARP